MVDKVCYKSSQPNQYRQGACFWNRLSTETQFSSQLCCAGAFLVIPPPLMISTDLLPGASRKPQREKIGGKQHHRVLRANITHSRVVMCRCCVYRLTAQLTSIARVSISILIDDRIYTNLKRESILRCRRTRFYDQLTYLNSILPAHSHPSHPIEVNSVVNGMSE